MEYSSDFAIYELIKDGKLAEIEGLLCGREGVLNDSFLGESFLHISASSDDPGVALFFIKKGLDVNILNNHFLTPLTEAAKLGNLGVVKCLLEQGAWVDGDPRGVTTPLIEAARGGFVNVVEMLIDHGADINRQQVKLNRTALDIARSYSQEQVAEVLSTYNAQRSFESIDDFIGDGAGILYHIANKVGPIQSYSYRVRDSVILKTALIKNKNSNKIIFTFGNFNKYPRIEFVMSLPYDWPLNQSVYDAPIVESFPLKVLSLISMGELSMEDVVEGYIFEKADPLFSGVIWPDDVDALAVIDYVFDSKALQEEDEGDSVVIYLLAPMKYPKSGGLSSEKIISWVSNKRTAPWLSVSIKK